MQLPEASGVSSSDEARQGCKPRPDALRLLLGAPRRDEKPRGVFESLESRSRRLLTAIISLPMQIDVSLLNYAVVDSLQNPHKYNFFLPNIKAGPVSS
ncbi:unnamed protein product [Caenorhabditis auriculariae]|uniref:Uncharacterized protein n=1 Tax=Caenorhabditis auriculariae TaxID=2777116 RepID=A0A8S1GQ58_9PELO|nr:unnamed protein product [Caenorhabditis auriculariae]